MAYTQNNSPFAKKTPCWKDYTNLDENGKQLFKMKNGKSVPDCRLIKKK
jgi:hypothetical protein|tara:strand:+ start:391 stop:537 length:147 start_codon:yes stop_codon:yes gene_type:complete